MPDVTDDRAQYKKTLGNFLSRDTAAKGGKKAVAGDSDSDEDGYYSKKKQDDAQMPIDRKDGKSDPKKYKIFDDDDCEGEGSDDSDDDDDESYENEVEDDDSEDQDDLLSSGDDNPAGGADSSGKKVKQPEKVQDEKVIAAKEVEKASFQTALDIPDDDAAIVATATTAEKVEAKPAE